MNNENQKTSWQAELKHHEELCVERGKTLDAKFSSIDVKFDAVEKRLDNIEKLQRFTIAAILAWPPILIAVVKLLS